MEDRLRKFAALVDSGTFTAAARDLHLSQPALSSAIRKLEIELHAKLLVHGIRQLILTDAGKIAYATAKDLAVCTDNLDVHLRELANAKLKLTLGMIDSVAATLFARPTTFDTLEQHAIVSIAVDNSRALLQSVERGELDFAFVTESLRRSDSQLTFQHVTAEPLVLVAKTAVDLQRNRLRRFISYDQASATFRIIEDALHRQGLRPDIAFFSTSPEVMLRLVLMGRGVAALPYLLVRESLNAGELIQLLPDRLPFLHRGIAVVQRRDRVPPSLLKSIVLGLRREIEALTVEASEHAAQASSAHSTSLLHH
jgi:DNA-binding transcriptional LysR family regulator